MNVLELIMLKNEDTINRVHDLAIQFIEMPKDADVKILEVVAALNLAFGSIVANELHDGMPKEAAQKLIADASELVTKMVFKS